MRAILLFFLMTISTFAKDLVWSDEFNGKELDLSKWKYAYQGERLDGVNCKESVRVEDGCLKIHVFSKDRKIYTGMVSTEGKFEFGHGYYEARMKFNDAPATWSDFWLYNPRIIDCIGAEIDIIEHRLFNRCGEYISGRVDHTLHYGGYGRSHRYAYSVAPWGDHEFHTVGLDWNESGYSYFIDDQLSFQVKGHVSDKPLFLVFSTEISNGNWAGYISKEPYDQETLIVDWVRVYK